MSAPETEPVYPFDRDRTRFVLDDDALVVVNNCHYTAKGIAQMDARISALEGLLRECSPYIVSYDSRAIPSEDAAAEALLSRLDAALTPDRKD